MITLSKNIIDDAAHASLTDMSNGKLVRIIIGNNDINDIFNMIE
jgi:hypothetical protein